MNIVRDIQPISILRRGTNELIERLRASGEPVVLTQKGEPRLVLQDVESYQELLECRDRLDTITAVRRGLDDMRAGRTRSAEEAFEALDRKHGLSD